MFITYRTATTEDSVATDKHDQRGGYEQTELHARAASTSSSSPRPRCTSCIKENFPEYEAAGYLGGSIRHDSYKWLIGAMVGSKRQDVRLGGQADAWSWRRPATTC